MAQDNDEQCGDDDDDDGNTDEDPDNPRGISLEPAASHRKIAGFPLPEHPLELLGVDSPENPVKLPGVDLPKN